MIVADLVKIGEKMMEMLTNYGITMGDYKFLQLFGEYENMVSRGDKISYAVATLSEKYNISERTIYRLLKRFCRPVKT